jgi:hypothetical protein
LRENSLRPWRCFCPTCGSIRVLVSFTASCEKCCAVWNVGGSLTGEEPPVVYSATPIEAEPWFALTGASLEAYIRLVAPAAPPALAAA